jgi:hypothetical protein
MSDGPDGDAPDFQLQNPYIDPRYHYSHGPPVPRSDPLTVTVVMIIIFVLLSVAILGAFVLIRSVPDPGLDD